MRTPQLSLRRLLLLVTVCSVLSLLATATSQGYALAVATGTVAVSLLVFITLQTVLFLVVRGFDRTVLQKRDAKSRNTS